MKTISGNSVAFDDLVNCFMKTSENRSLLIEPVGKGYIQTFRLEKGLEAKFWDCRFNEEVILNGYVNCEIENIYFTLAFFLNLDELTFDCDGFFLKENIIWDTIFISSATNFKIHIPPKAKLYGLSISFSRRWLIYNLKKNNIVLEFLTESIHSTNSPVRLHTMTSSDRKLIEELFVCSSKRTLGTFYIKSAVLKIVWDFSLSLKKEESATNNPCIGISIIEVEKYLMDNLKGSLPNLKDLAQKFSISESTLKRHFKRRHEVNISTYFNEKKRKYAYQLIFENKMNVNEVACMLGYKNVNKFIHFLIKHNKSK